MRPRPQDSIVVRLTLVATLVIAAVALIVMFHNLDAGRQAVPGSVSSGSSTGDAELIRCRDLGMAAAEDESCLAAWSEEQRRFLGTERAPEPREQSRTDTVGSVSSALPPVGETAEEAVDDQESGHGELAP
ncbi:putative entry exclusion protein TrbK-alt [Pelagibacterium luteolum]|uniref:Conjugative transfer region protein TrbK n=1 Tax=Pelagibacterium luteolum TaxID=440168 RepID=A0A1G7YI18_9HYPH|nr:putative entry exclusion protein TrbK-alt [Pelagibacterium luteolum]SDG96211.1 conjugative transfer region protein TrbK [Pelagibacterium luteolum]